MIEAPSYELKGAPLLEVVPIERRANCKMASLKNGRQFLIGRLRGTQAG
jgi:hypothetical protein